MGNSTDDEEGMKPDNPPAFSYVGQQASIIDNGEQLIIRPYLPANPGMSLRDYFANTALLALMSGKAPLDIEGKKISKVPNNLSKLAYEYADAMLNQRSKP